ncbi:retrovirus-related pol polyprotein LINE-1 [Tanacetum coccineum]
MMDTTCSSVMCSLNINLELVHSCLMNCDLESLSLYLELLEIINLASSLDHLCNTSPSCDLVCNLLPNLQEEVELRAASDGYPGVHRGFGFGVRNEEGRAILDFAMAHDLVVVNSYFKKRDHHLITFHSGGRCTRIDYLLVRRKDLKACKECSVFPGEACSSQHRLLALDTMFKSIHRRRVGRVTPRILWKNLTGDATKTFRSRVAEGVATQAEVISSSDADSMWNSLASIIKDAAKDTLGVAMGTSKTHTARRESWWLGEEVQSKVGAKQSRFKELLSCQEGNQEERFRAQEKYKEATKEAKKAVSQAKKKAYEEIYKKMDSKEGANDIFKIAKARERRRRDLGNICFIKDERG